MAHFSLGEKILLALMQNRDKELTLREVMQEKQRLFGEDTDHGTAAVTARLDYLKREGFVQVSTSVTGATTYSLTV
jgi:Fe2+ or Zn2+ uptake regulation protein